MSKATHSITLSTLVTNRRALLTGACCVAAATSVGILSAAKIDPIFGAIENHKAAHIAFSKAVGVSGIMLSDHPDYEAAQAATALAGEASQQTAIEMSAIVPTSVSGVVALLQYIDAFNRGEVCPGSEHHLWPYELTDDDVLTVKGHALEMPWSFWIMRNVQAALLALVAPGNAS